MGLMDSIKGMMGKDKKPEPVMSGPPPGTTVTPNAAPSTPAENSDSQVTSQVPGAVTPELQTAQPLDSFNAENQTPAEPPASVQVPEPMPTPEATTTLAPAPMSVPESTTSPAPEQAVPSFGATETTTPPVTPSATQAAPSISFIPDVTPNPAPLANDVPPVISMPETEPFVPPQPAMAPDPTDPAQSSSNYTP